MLANLVDLLVIAAAVIGFAVFAPLVYDFVRFRTGRYTVDPGPISGFTGKYSFRRGEPIDLYIHSTESATLTMLRLADGWKVAGAPTKIARQIQSSRYDGRAGYRWSKSETIDTSGLDAGLYQFLLRHERDERVRFAIPIFIKDGQPRPLSVILCTNTWDAYNNFGGLSHYENLHLGLWWRLVAKLVRRKLMNSKFVPANRPNRVFSDDVASATFGETYSSFLVRNELEFLVFLARQGYDFNVFSDDDLGHDPAVGEVNAMIFPGHSEYWANEMFYALERFLLKGGKVYRTVAGMEGWVRFTPLGIRFLRQPQEWEPDHLVGVHTDDQGQLTAAPFRAIDTDGWVFEGTGLKRGDLFGQESLNRPSFDVPGHAHLRFEVDLEGQPQNGASGFFTSKVGRGSGPFSILAVGTNPQGGAQMVYRDHPGGGWVFNAASIAMNGALLGDEQIARMICNLMDDAVGRKHSS